MNRFTQVRSWLAASLFAAASLVGQDAEFALASKKCEKNPDMMMAPPMTAGYAAPARINVRGSWDVYAEGSFTYWQAVQENMELGIVYNTTSEAIEQDFVNMKFRFHPGFKVGLGMNFDHDNWDTFVQYTWFRGTQNAHTTEVSPYNIYPVWGQLNGDFGVGTSLFGSEKWKLHMDLLDWELARDHYVGTSLSFRPFFAARAAWIRQNVTVQYHTVTTSAQVTTRESSHSWAIGPRAGLYSNWMLGHDFRLYGNGAGDILYTKYTNLTLNQTKNVAGVVTQGNIIHQRDLFGLRTHLDMELGFGWGSYFANNNWHVDLTAGYTFQVFFDQNMFRKYVVVPASGDTNEFATSLSPDGNLYVQGLTANVRFDF